MKTLSACCISPSPPSYLSFGPGKHPWLNTPPSAQFRQISNWAIFQFILSVPIANTAVRFLTWNLRLNLIPSRTTTEHRYLTRVKYRPPRTACFPKRCFYVDYSWATPIYIIFASTSWNTKCKTFFCIWSELSVELRAGITEKCHT